MKPIIIVIFLLLLSPLVSYSQDNNDYHSFISEMHSVYADKKEQFQKIIIKTAKKEPEIKCDPADLDYIFMPLYGMNPKKLNQFPSMILCKKRKKGFPSRFDI